MLQLNIPSVELYDEKAEIFFTIRGQSLKLEHSLVSLAKWESKWLKPFLTDDPMTTEETVDYIRHMTITQNVDPVIIQHVAKEHIGTINAYMALPMSATYFSKKNNPWVRREVVTAEIIYYWMTAYNIPFECQKWHLNRLLTFINVCNIKNQPKEKQPTSQILSQQHALNAKRLAEMNTKG